MIKNLTKILLINILRHVKVYIHLYMQKITILPNNHNTESYRKMYLYIVCSSDSNFNNSLINSNAEIYENLIGH